MSFKKPNNNNTAENAVKKIIVIRVLLTKSRFEVTANYATNPPSAAANESSSPARRAFALSTTSAGAPLLMMFAMILSAFQFTNWWRNTALYFEGHLADKLALTRRTVFAPNAELITTTFKKDDRRS